jgi:hypothetical protein
MSVTASTEIVGAKDAIKALRKLDPELRKQFNRDVKQIVAPIVDDAKNAYPQQMLSGMERNWTQRNNQKFPYNAKRARAGVKHKIDTRRDARSVIKVQQTDPAATIIEFAGKNRNPLGTALNQFGRVARFMWPAAQRNLRQVETEMTRSVMDAVRQVQKEI